jgi:hypothetical protein
MLRDTFCKTYTLAKHRHDPFLTSPSLSKNPLELLHMDLCGPFQTPMPDGGCWIMIVTDDHSKFKAVRILKAMSNVQVALEALINVLELKVGHHVQKARSDKGK